TTSLPLGVRDFEDTRGVLDGYATDVGVGDAAIAQIHRDVHWNMREAPTAERRQLRPIAHVVREEDAVGVAAARELDDRIDDLDVARLAVVPPTLVRELCSEAVILENGAAVGDGAVVVEVIDCVAHVPHHDTPEVSTALREDVENLEALLHVR